MSSLKPEIHATGRKYRRPLVLCIAASVIGEAILLVVYGIVLHPEGDLVAKALWTIVFCGLGMGSVVGALIVLFVVDRLEGGRAIAASAAISAAVIGVLCNALCFRLDSRYLHYFGAAEHPGAFLAPGIVLPGLLGAVYGWLMFTVKGRNVLQHLGW